MHWSLWWTVAVERTMLGSQVMANHIVLPILLLWLPKNGDSILKQNHLKMLNWNHHFNTKVEVKEQAIKVSLFLVVCFVMCSLQVFCTLYKNCESKSKQKTITLDPMVTNIYINTLIPTATSICYLN